MVPLSSIDAAKRTKLLAFSCAFLFALLIAVGVFASNGWFPATDPLSGERTGWFGRKLPKNAASSWNPLAAPPTPTPPQLSKEYLYAGSRLLAVEDANATAAPPADIAVWRPSNGMWMVMGQQGSQATNFSWGLSSDTAVPGDYDGDGKTDFSVWRPSEGIWYIMQSSNSTWLTYTWGVSTDIPSPADFDGDGRTDPTVMRRNTTTGYADWYVISTGGGPSLSGPWGSQSDTPGPADFDGDGRADIAVYRPSEQAYYWINSSNGALLGISLGQTGDKVVSSDYDGDGRADHAVYNSTSATWHIRHSSTGQVTSTQWGSAGNSGCSAGNCTGVVPVHNDYDGDGKTDLAVFNNAATAGWTIRRSSNGSTRTETFGTTGDIPVPAYYRR